ncbi:MAG: type II secretion system protein [Candidatus Sericytochromatia bacterium]|uniref:Type II secretion system protein n=1 Tax=Candidatus Tanganyikabacteria bacterium TaxID=2961651 RepID=A0A938BPH1_9BACT|nr:type II secretion system protein [Candidatus Tanganyikabacteria bacterium]
MNPRRPQEPLPAERDPADEPGGPRRPITEYRIGPHRTFLLKARSPNGFTLVELIVMMTVIGILIAVAVPNFSGAQDRARNSGVQHNLHLIQQAVEEYGMEINHQFPEKLSIEFVGKGNGFLPNDLYPLTPWAKQQRAATDLPIDKAKDGQVYLGVENEGHIEDPVATNSYGCVMWGIGPDAKGVGRSQQYFIAGNGKKARQTMRVLTVGNAEPAN